MTLISSQFYSNLSRIIRTTHSIIIIIILALLLLVCVCCQQEWERRQVAKEALVFSFKQLWQIEYSLVYGTTVGKGEKYYVGLCNLLIEKKMLVCSHCFQCASLLKSIHCLYFQSSLLYLLFLYILNTDCVLINHYIT